MTPLPFNSAGFSPTAQAVTKEMFDEALRALADDDFLTVTGKTIRLLA